MPQPEAIEPAAVDDKDPLKPRQDAGSSEKK